MKNEVIKTLEAIKDYLENTNRRDLVNIHNEYCREQRYSYDEIYSNDEEFFNTYFENKVLDAVRAISFGDYKYSHEYIKFNGLGNLETFNDPSGHVDIDAIAEAMFNGDFTPYDVELIEPEEEEETDGE